MIRIYKPEEIEQESFRIIDEELRQTGRKLPEMYAPVTRQACEYCNDFSALGAFGFFPDAGQIYLKHNTLLDSSLEFEKVITFFADNISLLFASVSRFIDGLATVGFTGTPLQAAIDQELFPRLG